MPKFSKYPWRVPEYIGVGFDIVDADGFNVAQNVREEADARLIAAAPDMYYALKECYGFIDNIISYDCKYCSRSLDAEGLRIALDDLFSSIDRSEDKGHDADA